MMYLQYCECLCIVGKLAVVTSCSADNKLVCASVSGEFCRHSFFSCPWNHTHSSTEQSQLWQFMCTHATLAVVVALIVLCLAILIQWHSGQQDGGAEVKEMLIKLMHNVL